MRSCLLLIALVACGPAEEGAPCGSEGDRACRDGRVLSCDGGAWVDEGTSDGPPSGSGVVGGERCYCEKPNKLSCEFLDY